MLEHRIQIAARQSESRQGYPLTGVKHEGLTADKLPCTVGSAMTTAVSNKFFPTRAIADVVIPPRGRRMFWKVAGKYNRSGKQKGPI
jgi:hypothetical protein